MFSFLKKKAPSGPAITITPRPTGATFPNVDVSLEINIQNLDFRTVAATFSNFHAWKEYLRYISTSNSSSDAIVQAQSYNQPFDIVMGASPKQSLAMRMFFNMIPSIEMPVNASIQVQRNADGVEAVFMQSQLSRPTQLLDEFTAHWEFRPNAAGTGTVIDCRVHNRLAGSVVKLIPTGLLKSFLDTSIQENIEDFLAAAIDPVKSTAAMRHFDMIVQTLDAAAAPAIIVTAAEADMPTAIRARHALILGVMSSALSTASDDDEAAAVEAPARALSAEDRLLQAMNAALDAEDHLLQYQQRHHEDLDLSNLKRALSLQDMSRQSAAARETRARPTSSQSLEAGFASIDGAIDTIEARPRASKPSSKW